MGRVKKKEDNQEGAHPPRLASALLRLLLGGGARNGALGDLEEQWRWCAQRRGAGYANARYRMQVLAAALGSVRNSLYWGGVMLRNYTIVAWRNIIRHRLFSTVNIAGLAIGMACCIMILLWIRDETSYDRHWEKADRLYRVYIRFDFPDGSSYTAQSTPPPAGPALKNDYADIANATRFDFDDLTICIGEKRFTERIAFVDPSFLEMFSLRLERGNPGAALSDPHSILLTPATAEKLFGNRDPIGGTLQIGRLYEAKVTGIVDPPAGNTHLPAYGAIAPIEAYRTAGIGDLDDWGHYFMFATYVELRPGARAAETSAKIAGLVKKYDSDSNATTRIQAIGDIRLRSLAGGGCIEYIYIFGAIGLLVLAIASINYMNLSTARASRRTMEVGVRRVVGAGRPQLAAQFLGESMLVTFISAGIAVSLVHLLLPHFGKIAGKELAMSYSPGTILLIACVAAVTGILSGSYPALLLSSLKPAKIIKGARGSGGQGSRFRKILVVAQFSISIFLTIGSLIIFEQMRYIDRLDLGIDTANVINLYPGREVMEHFEAIRNRLLPHPDITGVTRVNAPPVYVSTSAGDDSYDWDGRTGDVHINDFVVMSVDEDFAGIFGIEMSTGRFFSSEFPTDLEEGVVLNETAVRAMGIDDPVGKRFSILDFSGKIIGVARDFHYESLHEEITPLAILPRWRSHAICIGLGGRNTPETLASIESTIGEFEPGYRIDYRFIDDMRATEYREEHRVQSFVRYGTALAIFISCLGLVGLAAFTAERRTKEIGIRKVLGSSAAGIVALLSREFARWVLAANLIAWPLAWLAARRWLEGFAYRTTIGWEIFAISGAAALLIALLTVGWQALRAARANPVESLRYE